MGFPFPLLLFWLSQNMLAETDFIFNDHIRDFVMSS